MHSAIWELEGGCGNISTIENLHFCSTIFDPAPKADRGQWDQWPKAMAQWTCGLEHMGPGGALAIAPKPSQKKTGET